MSTISELKFTDKVKKKVFQKCATGRSLIIKDKDGNKYLAKLVDRPTDTISYTLDSEHAMKVRRCGEMYYKLVLPAV